MELKPPKPPKCILADGELNKALWIVSPSRFFYHAMAGTSEVIEYTEKIDQYLLDSRIMTKAQWLAHYRNARINQRSNNQ